jgi:hypothetical protein
MDYSNGTESEVSMDSVQLVAGLLICFPEFSKIRLDSKEKAVIMEISVREAPEKEKFEEAERLIEDSLMLYHNIEHTSGGKLGFTYENFSLQIYRDIASLSRGEVGLIVSLLKEKFADIIITDEVRNPDEDLIYMQSEMIDHRIRFLKENRIPESMVGVREEGRVMVYDHDLL